MNAVWADHGNVEALGRDPHHDVTVLENGYEYDNRTYRSLSEIAHLITGTKWSGPTFFGTKRISRKAIA